MRVSASSLFTLLFLPVLVFSQSTTPAPQSSAASPAASGVLTTSLSTAVVLDSNRQASTVTQTAIYTITPSPTATTNGTSSGNSTASGGGNGTVSTTPTKPLPTAPTDVNGGGNGPGGAPSPGQSAPGGIYGPPDGYIAAAMLGAHINTVLVAAAGAVVGGAWILA
ncbi:hypothetical protein JAAARDRAFT_44477 [Jaapia argillacea MUCL 33604]|uniref:Uncharacterized protein n=1 Tax=Jaapia argillacea MUCL 33604 TaxID=933084 RepID=A0A067Q9T1_9AGAM|nr:hypothetical protein JAAARDRAFT_44477 [Jaapia argillacea MUCL 33604]